MNRNEYQNAVSDNLTGTWGEKSYGLPQLNKLWTMVQHISVQEFRYALDQLSLSCNRAPSLGQVRGACLPAIQKAAEEQSKKRIEAMGADGRICALCDNGGYVYVIPFDNPCAEGVFLCPCEASRVRGFVPNRGSSYWRPELADKYFVRKFTGPSWLEAQKLQNAAFEKLKPKEVRSEWERLAEGLCAKSGRDERDGKGDIRGGTRDAPDARQEDAPERDSDPFQDFGVPDPEDRSW